MKNFFQQLIRKRFLALSTAVILLGLLVLYSSSGILTRILLHTTLLSLQSSGTAIYPNNLSVVSNEITATSVGVKLPSLPPLLFSQTSVTMFYSALLQGSIRMDYTTSMQGSEIQGDLTWGLFSQALRTSTQVPLAPLLAPLGVQDGNFSSKVTQKNGEHTIDFSINKLSRSTELSPLLPAIFGSEVELIAMMTPPIQELNAKGIATASKQTFKLTLEALTSDFGSVEGTGQYKLGAVPMLDLDAKVSLTPLGREKFGILLQNATGLPKEVDSFEVIHRGPLKKQFTTYKALSNS